MAINSVTDPIELPLIDISKSNDAGVGKEILDATIKYGFFYIDSRATAFTDADVDQAFALSKEFFKLSVEEKSLYRRGPNNRGWIGMNVETLDPERHERGDFKEAMNIGEFKDGKAQQQLPPCLVTNESQIAHFTDLCNRICGQILRLLALGLEMQEDFFTSRHDPTEGPTGNSVRLLYYPAAVSSYQPDKDIRAGAHSDYGSVTLLFQRPGQPGLEILTPENEWAPVPVYPDGEVDFPFPPILVNIGDMLSYWTDGLLKSTVHRVVFPLEENRGQNDKPQDRYSIAFFCQPVSSTPLVPVPSKIVTAYRDQKQEKDKDVIVGHGGGVRNLYFDKYRLTAGEHLQARLQATYISRS